VKRDKNIEYKVMNLFQIGCPRWGRKAKEKACQKWNLQLKLAFLNIEVFFFGRNVNKAMEGFFFWRKDNKTTFLI